MYGEKKRFCTWPTRAAKAEQKSLVLAWHAQRTNQGRTPFIGTLWVPIYFSFNSQQGPSLSKLSGEGYTHIPIKRQVTRHGCLPSLLGGGDKSRVKVTSEEKNCFVLEWLEQPRQDKNPFYRHDEPNEPTKEGPLSDVLLKSPFISVSKSGLQPTILPFLSGSTSLPSHRHGKSFNHHHLIFYLILVQMSMTTSRFITNPGSEVRTSFF